MGKVFGCQENNSFYKFDAYGGAERVASLLCNQWATWGYEVILVPTFSGREVCLHFRRPCAITILADRVVKSNYSVWNKINRLKAMKTLLIEHDPDALVSSCR